MRLSLRFALALLVLILGLTVAPVAAAAPGAAAPDASISKKKGKRARRACPRGKKLKRVRRNRKWVKRCVKVRSGQGRGPKASPLFAPPGRRLSGQEAVPFLQRYLLNSTFTDCPAGWPNCMVEERYSHTSGGAFYYCRLTSAQGADIINSGRAYQVQNVVVEADGSWAFNEVVDNYGSPSYYEWHVSTTGAVTGVYQYNGTQQIDPLQYVSGARDCSY
jgi:hypothetical protein